MLKLGPITLGVLFTISLSGTIQAADKPLFLSLNKIPKSVSNSIVHVEGLVPAQIDQFFGDVKKVSGKKILKRDPKSFYFAPIAPGHLSFDFPLRLGPGTYEIELRGYSSQETNELEDSPTYRMAFSIENTDTGRKLDPSSLVPDKALKPIFGPQKALVLLVNHADNRSRPTDKKIVAPIAFGSAPSFKDFYTKVSRGKISIDGNVAGWFEAASGCPTYGGNGDYGKKLADEADELARKSGIKLEQYNRFFYIFPMDGCNVYSGWGGPGMDPAGKTRTFLGLKTEDRDPRKMTASERNLLLHGFIHEFGHNIGLHHANSKTCEAPLAVNDWDKCSPQEYGDQFSSAMGAGNGDAVHLLNAPNLIALGWIDESEIVDVEQSGVVELAPLYSRSKAPKVLRILRSFDKPEHIYASYRPNLEPYDSENNTTIYSANPIGIGANLQIWSGLFFEQTYGIRPLGSTKNALGLADDLSYLDSVSNVRLTQISHDEDSVKIDVNFEKPGCKPAPPFVQVQYYHHKTGWTTKGPLEGNPLYLSKPFKIMIFNQDSNECEPSQFKILSTFNGGHTKFSLGHEVTLSPQKLITLDDQLKPKPGFRETHSTLSLVVTRSEKRYNSGSNEETMRIQTPIHFDLNIEGFLEPPRDLQVTSSGNANTLTWRPIDPPAQGLFYSIKRFPKNSFSATTYYVPAEKDQFVDTEADPSKEYIYEVRLQEGHYLFTKVTSEPARAETRP